MQPSPRLHSISNPALACNHAGTEFSTVAFDCARSPHLFTPLFTPTAHLQRRVAGSARRKPNSRATNAQLTDAGETAYEASRSLYATALRRMVLDGLDADGVTQLADLSHLILTKLDPDARLKITEAGRACAADPVVM